MIATLSGVSPSSQRNYEIMFKTKHSLEPIKRNHQGLKNPNCKLTPEYVERLKTLVHLHPDWTYIHLENQLNTELKIHMPKSSFAEWMHKIKASRKILQVPLEHASVQDDEIEDDKDSSK